MNKSKLKQIICALALSSVTILGPSSAFADSLCEQALTVYQSNLVQSIQPQKVIDKPSLADSAAFNDPWLELARQTKAWQDFKRVSDLEARPMTEAQKSAVIVKAAQVHESLERKLIAQGVNAQKAKVLADAGRARWIINHLFRIETGLKRFTHPIVEPQWKLKPNANQTGLEFSKVSASFDHIEKMWSALARTSAPESKSSLIPTPFPMMVAGERFNEGYYWDAYIGAIGLTLTGRSDMAAAQLENFLHMIQTYGKVPNGFRQYYLGRSQPPVIPLFAKLVYETAKLKISQAALDHWWQYRVYPLLIKDYSDFWRALRFDADTGLYFHDDNLEEILGRKDVLRPERHSNDNEYCLGVTPRDVRAEAESGRDHTDATMLSCRRLATVEVNALMYAYGKQLAEMAKQFGNIESAKMFEAQAHETRAAMNKHLWDGRTGVYRNYHLDQKVQSEVVTAEIFWTLHTGLATPAQAKRMIEFAQSHLEGGAGLRGSTADSDKQWDRKYFWAVDNQIAAMGASKYGYVDFAKRITRSFMSAAAEIHSTTGHFYEKIGEDQLVGRDATPEDDATKYPTQTGFLWTNAYFVWGLKFLGYEFEKR